MNSLTYLTPFLHWVQNTAFSQWTRSSPAVFTSCLVIHFIGLSLLMGSMLIVDLRLLGFPRQLPIASALKFLPTAILGFVINLCTGATMFAFDPFNYWLNPAFRIKMAFVLVGGLNALWFTAVEHRHVLSQPAGQRTAMAVRVSAALSLLMWFTVMFWGRMIVAFQGAPNL